MTPKETEVGTLIAIGGNEDKTGNLEVLRRIINEGKGDETHIEVVTTASDEPQEMAKTYKQAFQTIGVNRCEVMNITNRDEANNPKYLERINEADIIFFTGGDQLRLTSLLGGSIFLKAVKENYRSGTVIAGTSAGAAVLSDTMIYEGDSRESLLKGKVHLTSGFGLVRNVIFDTHFMDRGRIGRLFQAVASNPTNIGVGLNEDTSVVMRKDSHTMEAVGSGQVIIVDGSKLKSTNISKVDTGMPIAIENIIVHSLVAGYRFDLENGRFITPEEGQ